MEKISMKRKRELTRLRVQRFRVRQRNISPSNSGNVPQVFSVNTSDGSESDDNLNLETPETGE